MASTNPQGWARVRGVAGIHLVGLRPGSWYRVASAPPTAAPHMRDDLWLEVDGRIQWFGRTTHLEFSEGDDICPGHDGDGVP